MDPALNVDPTADRFRREVFEFHRRLPGMGDAEVLGVEAGVDAAAETAAFVARAKRFHPDSAGQKDDELGAKLHAIFIRLLEAHRRLAAQAAKAPTRTPTDALPKAPERAVLPPTLTAPAVIAAAPRTAASDAAARKQGVEAGLREARGLLDAGRAEESIPALQEIFGRADEGQKWKARLLFARAYVADAQTRRHGLALLRDLTAEQPDNAEVLAILGGVYRREGLLKRAERTLGKALANDPGNPEARAELRDVRDALRRPRPRQSRQPVPRLFAHAR